MAESETQKPQGPELNEDQFFILPIRAIETQVQRTCHWELPDLEHNFSHRCERGTSAHSAVWPMSRVLGNTSWGVGEQGRGRSHSHTHTHRHSHIHVHKNATFGSM